jgi:hypothetical protein
MRGAPRRRVKLLPNGDAPDLGHRLVRPLLQVETLDAVKNLRPGLRQRDSNIPQVVISQQQKRFHCHIGFFKQGDCLFRADAHQNCRYSRLVHAANSKPGEEPKHTYIYGDGEKGEM